MMGKTKKYLSVLVAALICATSIGSFNVFAAGEKNGTMHFNDLHYVNFNGNTSEGAANITMVTSDTPSENYVTYCIDTLHNTYDGTTYISSDSYPTPPSGYLSLSEQQQMWLDEALMFGYNRTALYTWDSYEATQCLAWIITQTEYFDVVQESNKEKGLADDMLGVGTTARSDYESIRANMMSFDALSKKIPSFTYATSSEASANPIVLNYNRTDSKFELTLPLSDANKVLEYFDFTKSSGITVAEDVINNTLTLSSNTLISSLALSATSSLTPSDVLQGAQGGLPLYWISAGNQILVSFDPSRTNKPVTAYLNVKTQDVGSIKIVKTSGDNLVEGLKFNISQGGTVIATVTTDKDGITTASNLPIGDNYTVSEQDVPDKYIAPATQSGVTVTYGETTTVNFNNALKTGSIKIVKTSGDNLVEGLKFNISQGGTVIATVTTDKDGIATASNLPIGDNYTVSEINVPARYAAPASQSVTVSNDKTTEVDFYNVLNIPDNPIPTTTTKSIIIHYYFAGTHTPVHADGTAEGIIGSPLTLTAPAVDGYSIVAPGTSTITVQEGENVVVFYYTKNIAENTTPLGSNPATGDKGTAIPLFAALASLFTFAGITVSRKIKKLRKSA
jgi:GTP:adenosylcobinamide-phosphate guanylyltransferase